MKYDTSQPSYSKIIDQIKRHVEVPHYIYHRIIKIDYALPCDLFEFKKLNGIEMIL